ncbi:fibronectin type III domain-containing protein [Pedobacter insulae]|uniref:Fibronectin type-III domain-containing protein n=1 Tax=Pedobacter insulae TaxID=414048 RepID=A0A1I2XSV7_9SPHI|nr:fibronectin type III domain-containing protein [Pedobacter insulae]SFH16455.1 hypothetical protein SAMN04489864_10610 [Pedobacter insulae]
MKYLIGSFLLLVSTSIVAQQKVTATYEGGDIILSYNPIKIAGTDTLVMNVYRKGNDGEKLIRANKKIATRTTVKFADTSVRNSPGVYQYILKIKKDTLTVDAESIWAYAFAPDVRPIATVFNAVNAKHTNNIILNWKISDNYWVKDIALLRSRSMDGKYQLISNINPQDTLYIDKVNDANEPFFYRLDMKGFNSDRVYSSASVVVVPQFPIIPYKVNGIKTEQRNKAIVVSWKNNNEFARGFYIKKRIGNAGEFEVSSPLIFKNKTGQYLWKDTLSSLKPREMYQYVVVAESNSFDLSKHSDTATISFGFGSQGIAPPTDLRILTANDTTYSLVWTVDSLRRQEISGYQVYQKRKGETAFRLLKDGYTDNQINYLTIANLKDGDAFQVKSIGVNKESIPSMTFVYKNPFEREFGPTYLKAAVYDNVLNIKWLKDETLKVKVYKLYKWNGKAFMLIETVSPDKDAVATRSYVAGQLNIYQLKTVDLAGVESVGSKPLQVN